MANLKAWIKAITPPLVLSFAKHLLRRDIQDISWHGHYLTWNEAKSKCMGYDTPIILETCKNALLQVKNGTAVYERDGVLFEEIQHSWGLLAGLQKAALENNDKLCVMDFGGSLGSSYFQNRLFLKSIKKMQWCIIEQEHFVNCGKVYFEDDQLKFYFTIEECLKTNKPDVLLLSSVLQYLENPFDWIKKFTSLEIPYIILDRTAFIDSNEDCISIQNVPGSIYQASYPAWFFQKKKFVEYFKDYEIIGYFDSGYTSARLLDEKRIYWEGIILKR